MYRHTTVPVPPTVTTDEALAAWLTENTDEWDEALDLDVEYLDDRAFYQEHQIVEIVVVDGKVRVEYSVEYDAYYGCKDMDLSDWDDRDITGQWSNGQVVFTTFVQPMQGVPDDEL
ncbi:hypothetical protein [Stenotrophomonas maltophilia]|uniref:hypothetical protein n=1 Tax=Stenotrophomonas maltophilia TaxID=40324 RepID=UPI000B0F0057|nr:hypothetical protein [Stenotrophomonas maltophilia]